MTEYLEKWINRGNIVNRFPIDMCEEDDHYILMAELPGFNKENITVSVDNGILKIFAYKRRGEEMEIKKHKYDECKYGHFRRELNMANDIDTNNITASYIEGVLRLDIYKVADTYNKPTKIVIT